MVAALDLATPMCVSLLMKCVILEKADHAPVRGFRKGELVVTATYSFAQKGELNVSDCQTSLMYALMGQEMISREITWRMGTYSNQDNLDKGDLANIQ